MPLTNYAELKTQVQQWAHRDDVPGIVDDVILMVEADMFEQNEHHPALSVREMETRATATADTTTRFLALPDSFMSMRRLRISDSVGSDIKLRSPEGLVIKSGSGRPRYFSTTSQLEFDIQPDSAYTLEMIYFKRPTGLSSANTTNDILTNYPNIYALGCQWAVKMFQNEPQLGAVWYGMFSNAIRGASRTDRRGRFSAASVMGSERPTP